MVGSQLNRETNSKMIHKSKGYIIIDQIWNLLNFDWGNHIFGRVLGTLSMLPFVWGPLSLNAQ